MADNLLTYEQWREVERRRAIAREHCDKKIAADLGVNVKLMQKAIYRYRKFGRTK